MGCGAPRRQTHRGGERLAALEEMIDPVDRVPDYFYHQSAVIPYRCRGGHFDILMISSRKKKRWVVPKGVIEPQLCARTSAIKEAQEEAGIEGAVSERPIGRYHYQKWGGTCRVDVFLMRVDEVSANWEENHRDREWVSLPEAIRRTKEAELKRLLHSLPGLVPITQAT